MKKGAAMNQNERQANLINNDGKNLFRIGTSKIFSKKE